MLENVSITTQKATCRLHQRQRAKTWLADAERVATENRELQARMLDALLRGSEVGMTIACFAGQGAEPDLAPVAWALVNEGRGMVLPKVLSTPAEGAHMAFGWVRMHGPTWSTSDLIPGAWGILEPPHVDPPVRPDIVVVPALGGDVKGHRLGQGAGYYDQYLSQGVSGRRPLTVMPLLSWQWCTEIPTDIHDIVIDRVIGWEHKI